LQVLHEDHAMPDLFYLTRALCTPVDNPNLREVLEGRTGSDAEVASILRSLARFGTDPSIIDFVVSPAPARSGQRLRAVTWTVRANRS